MSYTHTYNDASSILNSSVSIIYGNVKAVKKKKLIVITMERNERVFCIPVRIRVQSTFQVVEYTRFLGKKMEQIENVQYE